MRSLVVFLIAGFLCNLVLCTEIFDFPELQYLNETVDPCDNFYEFTCGNFKNVHPLPPNQQMWDHFVIVQEEIHELAKEILIAPRTRIEPQALQKAKAFYTSCIRADNMDGQANGYHAHVEVLKELNKWPAITADYNASEPKLGWTQLAQISANYGLSFFFSFSILPALMDPTANVIYIQRDTLNYPDAAGIRAELPKDATKYLFSYSENRQNQENPGYLNFLKNIAFHMRNITNEKASDTQVITQLEQTINFMEDIATGMDDNDTIPFLSQETTVKQLQNWTDHVFGENFLDWVTYLNIHVDESKNVVTESTKVLHLNSSTLFAILNQYNLATSVDVKNYIIARLMTHMAPDSDRFMIEKWKEFSLMNNNTVYDRDDYCIRKTLGYKGNIGFSLAVTYQYQEYHFNPQILDKANNMVTNVQNTFLTILKELEWMDQISKENAFEKGEKLITLLGYPEEIVEDNSTLNEYYDDMQVCSWDHFGNAQRMRAFGLTDNLKPIASEKKRHLWNLSPLEVNAFYNRGNNRVLIPISILNPVFFRGDNLILDYARLGSIIGHEITHGFDKSGKDYNAEGIIGEKLWTSETLKNFEEQTKCFEQQYFKYYIEEIDEYVKGNLTLNENLADNGGLKIAYKTWKEMTNGIDIHKMPKNYTPEQMFFIGFGTMWCSEESEYYLSEMNRSGSYSPARFRVIGPVSNMQEFAEAFQCPVGSKMNPKDKCHLW